MTEIEKLDDQLLLHKLSNSSRTNLSKWFEGIVDDFCKEQVIEERTSIDEVKQRFHDDFHDSFLCIFLKPLFKFPIYKGIAHIVEP